MRGGTPARQEFRLVPKNYRRKMVGKGMPLLSGSAGESVAAQEVGRRAMSRPSDVARNARTLEWLKAELAGGVAASLRGMARGDAEAILDGLSDVLIYCYLLARRLGVHLQRVDLRAHHKLAVNVGANHQLEQWYGDLSAVAGHLESRIGWPGAGGRETCP